jgi:micrococcal nuclease
MRKLWLVLAVLAGPSLVWAQGEPPAPVQVATDGRPEWLPQFGTALKVRPILMVDGDTFAYSVPEGTVQKVRMIGIDTPETVHPNKPVEHFGKEASKRLKELIFAKDVWLIIDPQQGEKDKYGRILAYVYRVSDQTFINLEMVRTGYAHAYVEYPFRFQDEFVEAERLAKAVPLGLWRPAPTLPEPTTPPPDRGLAARAEVEPPATPEWRKEKGETVYVTKSGTKYHWAGCRLLLAKSSTPMDLEEARKAHSPCSKCMDGLTSKARARIRARAMDMAISSPPPQTFYGPPAIPFSGGGTVHVRGYYRSNGTYVAPYTRSAPRR